MIPYHIIRRKRDGAELDPEELGDFLRAYAQGELPDYQMSAFLMAVFHRGLSNLELNAMVGAILASGIVLDLSRLPAPAIDKHSTGGVGDKVSIVLAPLVAALGVYVPMMSGRGLGHTGGTVDKLESIPGFRVSLTIEEMMDQLESLGCALITQTDEIAPLDRMLYALRDVTATIESIPLIASSIMSKKIAEGIDGLVLDVKRGNGAFMPELERGLELAQTMIAIGEAHGRHTVALLTAMDRPLGYAVGNALEIEESILALRGEGPPDLRALTIAQAVEMVLLSGRDDRVQVEREVTAALDNGSALDLFRRIVEAQGGNPAVVDDPALLPQARVRSVLTAQASGTITEMDVRAIGEAAVALGAGRAHMESVIDPAVGFHITVKTGERVERGQALATVHAQSENAAQSACRQIEAAITIGEGVAAPLPLISHRITRAGIELL